MRCSKCGAENPDKAKFCVKCGSLFAGRYPVCHAEESFDAEFCIERAKPLDTVGVQSRGLRASASRRIRTSGRTAGTVLDAAQDGYRLLSRHQGSTEQSRT